MYRFIVEKDKTQFISMHSNTIQLMHSQPKNQRNNLMDHASRDLFTRARSVVRNRARVRSGTESLTAARRALDTDEPVESLGTHTGARYSGSLLQPNVRFTRFLEFSVLHCLMHIWRGVDRTPGIPNQTAVHSLTRARRIGRTSTAVGL